MARESANPGRPGNDLSGPSAASARRSASRSPCGRAGRGTRRRALRPIACTGESGVNTSKSVRPCASRDGRPHPPAPPPPDLRDRSRPPPDASDKCRFSRTRTRQTMSGNARPVTHGSIAARASSKCRSSRSRSRAQSTTCHRRRTASGWSTQDRGRARRDACDLELLDGDRLPRVQWRFGAHVIRTCPSVNR